MTSPLELLRSDPLVFAMLAISLVFAIALHEFAHAWAADVQGDRLPRAMGRLTLNPVRHLDPLGTILLLLVGFGWGKPVEFRPNALRSERFGGALVALAGPAMNVVLAIGGALALRVLGVTTGPGLLVGPAGLAGRFADFFLLFMVINILLAVFNLIPIPPLDGSRLLTIFLPPGRHNIVYFLDRYGFLILIGLLVFGGLTFIEPLVGAVADVIFALVL